MQADFADHPAGVACVPVVNPALARIQQKGYAAKYRCRTGIQVHEVGIVFSRKLRNLVS